MVRRPEFKKGDLVRAKKTSAQGCLEKGKVYVVHQNTYMKYVECGFGRHPVSRGTFEHAEGPW